jgi:hypothetical protein
MNLQVKFGSILMLGFLLAPAAHAETPTSVQNEVNFLLGYVEGSGCQFYRNGTWHNSKDAQVHLRDKYKWLVARNQINTSEDFIEKAATQSSFSGLAYAVACNGGAAVPSKQWLRAELARLRTY